MQLEFEFLQPRRRPYRTDLTATRARQLLKYDAQTGALTWRLSLGGWVKAGREAGNVHRGRRTSYRQVKIDGVQHPVHRVVFLWYYGAMPAGEIDHIDQNGLNNRISNLRAAATKTINARNHPRHLNNKSGVNGVRWYRATHKWVARIRVGGKDTHLGYFGTLAEAAMVRKRAERLLGYHENHGREKVVA